MFEGIFGYIIGGLVIGVLARLIKPGADPMGWIMTIVLGIVGAVIGGQASVYFGLGGFMTWVVAIVAAIILLFIFEAMRAKRPAAR
ncbi:GlsB/YeaQ/YmgE family stress response membrane protein [Lysobacter pythonis]|uniref:GlsB/YeaQ/YmgE family stress response membrane protein n=1 Tax=Solilutibacter pythonis TaxID=2483112 RepID=A0A3M2HYG8_9GAMM|nr:GlsB/YeaQ/YmgE family stress response membrane protein [Lysobacter pythonis]RMH94098.1 GlsB/YeaQ/YmgE family stress response membrane protein [Lysobacter pythonis]